MTKHIADQAGALAALSVEDPDRVQAYAHAAECPPCAEALAEGERLVALLNHAPAPAPSERALAVARSAVLSEFEPSPVALRAPPRSFAILAVIASAILAWLDAHGGTLSVGVGVECASIELGAAAGAVALAFVAARSGIRALPATASIAAWGAVAGQVYLHFRCPVAHDAPHVVVFHFGAVVAAALVFAVLNPKGLRAG